MQISTTAICSKQDRQSALKPRANSNERQVRALLSRALLDSMAWNAGNLARRKRLGLD